MVKVGYMLQYNIICAHGEMRVILRVIIGMHIEQQEQEERM